MASRTVEGPRILLLDIETFPNLYYSWRLWEGHALDTIEFSKIVCFSVKWLDGKQFTYALPDFNDDEKKLIQKLWDFVDEADILIAHNGKAFDFGRMNSAFIKNGLNPPSPCQRYDTKKAAKTVFGFDSNSLDNLCQLLNLGSKMETGGYDLWRQCMAGNKSAWAKMKKYNAHDIVLLEKLYLKLRAWSPDHPNVALWKDDGAGCPHCGSYNLQKRGKYYAKTRIYQRFQCQDCGGWGKYAGQTIGRSNVTAVTG